MCSGRCGPCCSIAPSGWTRTLPRTEPLDDLRRPQLDEGTDGTPADATALDRVQSRGRGGPVASWLDPTMLAGSLTVGRIAGATLRIHWSAVVIGVVLGLGLGQGGDLGPVAAIIGVVAFFASILAHELSHAVVARHYGVATTTIDLWALGGVARLTRSPTRPEPTAGSPPPDRWPAWPSASSATAPPSCSTRSTAPTSSSPCSAGSGVINGLLAVFNMLPGAPLDGGRVVRADPLVPPRQPLPGHAGGRPRPAASSAGASPPSGFSLLINGRGGMWIAITGFFIAVNARAELTLAGVGERLAGVKVKRRHVVRRGRDGHRHGRRLDDLAALPPRRRRRRGRARRRWRARRARARGPAVGGPRRSSGRGSC